LREEGDPLTRRGVELKHAAGEMERPAGVGVRKMNENGTSGRPREECVRVIERGMGAIKWPHAKRRYGDAVFGRAGMRVEKGGKPHRRSRMACNVRQWN